MSLLDAAKLHPASLPETRHTPVKVERTGLVTFQSAIHQFELDRGEESARMMEHVKAQLYYKLGAAVIAKVNDGRDYVVTMYSGEIKPRLDVRTYSPNHEDFCLRVWFTAVIVVRSFADSKPGEYVAFGENVGPNKRCELASAPHLMPNLHMMQERLEDGRFIWMCKRVR